MADRFNRARRTDLVDQSEARTFHRAFRARRKPRVHPNRICIQGECRASGQSGCLLGPSGPGQRGPVRGNTLGALAVRGAGVGVAVGGIRHIHRKRPAAECCPPTLDRGLLVGQKRPLLPQHVWSIRVRLASRARAESVFPPSACKLSQKALLVAQFL